MTTVAVIGAGIAGLVCAIELTRAGRSVKVFESEREVGGRVRTSWSNGCAIDRGFQVLFTAYPTLRSYLDLNALKLRAFRPAAHVVTATTASLIGDALRDPTLLLETMTAGDIPLVDKLRLLALRRHAKELSIEECFALENVKVSTRTMLERRGFSSDTINNFFAPFYGGILLDRTLHTNAGMLLFTFKMLAEGDAAVPAAGMGAIAGQLAAQLPHETIMTGARSTGLQTDNGAVCGVVFEDGAVFETNDVVLATDSPSAAMLAETAGMDTIAGIEGLGSTSVYFTANEAPLAGKSLWLNASSDAVFSHTVTLTEVAPEYAPGKHLLVATAIGAVANLDDTTLESAARRELSHMATIGQKSVLPALETVAIVRVPYSQFKQPPGTVAAVAPMSSRIRGLWRASEVQHSSSLEGAARAGQMTATALLGTGAGRDH